jgi:cytochrome P450
MYGENELQINPANTYPWPLVTKAGKPMVVSAEMAVVYRFHEFIIPSFPIKDAKNNTIWEQDLFGTGFNATGFVDAGLENVLRGMVGSTIPNFKSGVDDAFRNAGKYRGRPFDVATWSVIHEREQGLPTFNNYFIEYNKQDPHVVVPIRKTFEDFSSDPKMVANLKRLYKSPDHVDLVVGVQLEEEMFPGTTVPKSALIISLFSLFGMGNSDRFSVGFAMMRCLLVDKPWDCHPTNALEELIWAPKKVDGFPNFRFYDTFWLTEMDFQAHGTNLLWRLITENSEIKCVQHSPLFPADPVTNPVLCSLPKEKPDPKVLGVTVLEVAISLYKKHLTEVLGLAGTVISILLGFLAYKKETAPKTPPILSGLPIIGEALTFQKNPLKILTEGFQKYRKSPSKSFGIKLASMTHFVITDPRDLELMKEDNPYEVKFSLHLFLQAINFGLITKKVNFDSDLHTKLIRTHLSDPTTIAAFGPVIEEASKTFLERNPLVVKGQTTGQFNSLNDWCTQYITFVTSRCIVGPKGYDNDELLKTFMKFNDDAIKAMGLSSLLPSFLQFLAAKEINKDFEVVRRILAPVITARRNAGLRNSNNQPVFLDFIMEAVDDNQRVADLVAIVVWGGLVNLQANFTSTLLDILNEPGLQNTILSSLKSASPSNLNTFSSSNPQWKVLRSAMFESIRLSGPITGPARILLSSVPLASDPSLTLPKGKVATLSAYYTHRQPSNWGPTAASYDSSRFVQQDPPIGEPSFVTWGLKGPHSCPGRWFAQEAICLMVKGVLESYEFRIERVVAEEEKYVYTAGNVGRTVVGGMVVRR